jgi:hypothetical protein
MITEPSTEFETYNPLKDSQFYNTAITNLQMRSVKSNNPKVEQLPIAKLERNYVQDA